MCLAIPGIIEQIEGEDPMFRTGRVTFDGVGLEVGLAFTPEAQVGDYVLVHAGVAINIVDEEEAHEILKTFEQLEDI